jgi:hypothetical protein
VGRRSRRRGRGDTPAPVSDYADPEGNVLRLRDSLSEGTLRELRRLQSRPGASQEDRFARRTEMLFERLAVEWTIAGLPLKGQKELLGRLRLADSDTRAWVRATVDEHLRQHQPEARDVM